MIKILTKKISLITITVLVLFISVFSMSMFANATSNFSPRLSAPSSSNEYYYSDKNIFQKYGYGMPNCTAYAFGRAYELLKKEPNLCHYSAEDWYDYNKNNKYYSYGSTPKLGAIACWTYGTGGHVAVVEKIENDTITFSNSAYQSTNFYLTTAKTNDSHAGVSKWTFQGYIYIGDFSPTTATTKPTTKPTTYKAGIYKVNDSDGLNLRSDAGTSSSIITTLNNNTKLTITKFKANGSTTWGYTTYNGKSGWVAMDYCVYVSEIPTTAPTTVAPTTVPATTPSTLLGDVNLDGKITVTDATYIQKYLVNKITLNEQQLKNADYDKTGKISIADSTLLQKYLSNKL